VFRLAQAKAVSLTVILLFVLLAVSLLTLGLRLSEKPVTETILLTTTERATETSTTVLTSTKLAVETVTQKEVTTIVAPPSTVTLTSTRYETVTTTTLAPALVTVTVTAIAPPTTITRTVTTTTTITSTTTQYITHTSTTTTITNKTTTIIPLNLTTAFIYKAEEFELKINVPTYLSLATPDSKKPSTVDIYLKKNYPLTGFYNIDLEFGVKVKLPSPALYIFLDADTLIFDYKITDVFRLEWPIYGIPKQAINLGRGDIGVYALATPIKEAKGNLEELPIGEWIHVGSYNLYVVEESNLMALGIPAENVVIGRVLSLETP